MPIVGSPQCEAQWIGKIYGKPWRDPKIQAFPRRWMSRGSIGLPDAGNLLQTWQQASL